MAINYELPTENYGTFDFLWSGTYYTTFEQQVGEGAPFTDYLGDFSSDDFGVWFAAAPPFLLQRVLDNERHRTWRSLSLY